MPFRRRPPEPSPRLRALLEAAGRDRGAPGGGAGLRAEPDDGSGGATYGAGDDIGVPRPWLPDGPVAPGRHRRPRPPGPAFLTLPESLRGARLSSTRAAAVGLLLVVALAAACFGVRIAWARAASQPRVVAPGAPGSAVAARGSATVGTSGGADSAGSNGFASSPTASGGGGPPSTAATVTVDVVGQVRRPGVLRLAAGSRVTDAVAAAGGMRGGADAAAINLARVLVDGEQIRVPKLGEVQVTVPGGGQSGAAGAGGADGSGAAGVPGAPVNLNTASVSELDALPGVGPVLAQRIIDWRTEHGRFASVDELGEVSGIGEKIFAQLRPKVTV